jgi:hypothetical protein
MFQGPTFDDLPRGEWIVFGRMPAETTADNFAEWLRNLGLDVTPDRILVQSTGRRCSVVVSFPVSEFAALVNWVINNQPFMSLQAVALPYSKKHRS